MPDYLVIATSLRPGSHSRLMATQITSDFSKLGVSAELIALADHPLPLCDGDAAYGHPSVGFLARKIQEARVILVASPIYNYDLNAAAKNLVELTGSAWEDKIVGFLCAAGGALSYMSVMAFANSLMLDFRCVILPRFVYATEDDFGEGQVKAPAILKRIGELAASAVKLGGAGLG